MGHMSSSHQFAIMSVHASQRNYHEVCTIYLSHFAISSIDSGKGSRINPCEGPSLFIGVLMFMILVCTFDGLWVALRHFVLQILMIVFSIYMSERMCPIMRNT